MDFNLLEWLRRIAGYFVSEMFCSGTGAAPVRVAFVFVRLHMNGLIPSERTKEQTTVTVP